MNSTDDFKVFNRLDITSKYNHANTELSNARHAFFFYSNLRVKLINCKHGCLSKFKFSHK